MPQAMTQALNSC